MWLHAERRSNMAEAESRAPPARRRGCEALTVTFDAFVPLVPASELVALGGGHVGVAGAVHDGRDHALRDKEDGRYHL